MNEGDPFGSFFVTSIQKKPNGIILGVLISSTAKPRTIDNIVIKGYEKVPTAYLSQVAKIKKGKTFNYEALIEGANSLEQLPTITVIKPHEIKFEKNQTEVYVYLEKKSINTFDGLLGFSNNNEENTLQLDGYANIRLINNLNYAEDLSLSYKSDGDDQERITVNLTLPYIFNTAFGVNGHLDLFRRDSTFSSNRQKFNATYQINPRLNIYGGYENFTSENLADESIVLNSVKDLDANFFSSGIMFASNRLNNVLQNIKTSLNLEGNIGERSFQETTEDQLILSIKGWHYFKFNSKNFFYLKNESSWIRSDSYLTNELKRFGGILSLRGFEENSIDASLYSATQTEYIYLLSQGLFVNSIFDVAYYQNDILDLEESLYSIGVGFGLNTKTGLLKLNFANGTTSDQNFEFSNSKVHISLIANF
ncbi:hypothetical protein GCM10009117_26750 [Gangjinia marincola]|uniref:Haemolysin activator HlyB C-terminal domain-containing protein n=2 Tax=Gangjinia marincola TaxID=578463 RepID=A0ABP3XYR2_9FLAO